MELVRIADIFAIPMFILLTFYFITIKTRTNFETLLLIFSISGLILDTLFTIDYIVKSK